MEFQRVIEERRSIRKYLNQGVKKEDIDACVEAASLAPTWKNSQTGRYYIITNNELLDKFKAECLPMFNENNVENAPVLIVSTFIKNKSGFDKVGNPNNECGNGWGYYDLGLQNQNFVLKAKDLGLDTLIMGIRDESKIRKLCCIPETEIIVAVISLGYRDINPEMPKRLGNDEIVKYFE